MKTVKPRISPLFPEKKDMVELQKLERYKKEKGNAGNDRSARWSQQLIDPVLIVSPIRHTLRSNNSQFKT
jgi:hypothetical protein